MLGKEKKKLFVIFCNTIVTYEYVNFLGKLKMPTYWIIHDCHPDLLFKWYNDDNNLYSVFSFCIIHICHSVKSVCQDIPHKKKRKKKEKKKEKKKKKKRKKRKKKEKKSSYTQ